MCAEHLGHSAQRLCAASAVRFKKLTNIGESASYSSYFRAGRAATATTAHPQEVEEAGREQSRRSRRRRNTHACMPLSYVHAQRKCTHDFGRGVHLHTCMLAAPGGVELHACTMDAVGRHWKEHGTRACTHDCLPCVPLDTLSFIVAVAWFNHCSASEPSGSANHSSARSPLLCSYGLSSHRRGLLG